MLSDYKIWASFCKQWVAILSVHAGDKDGRAVLDRAVWQQHVWKRMRVGVMWRCEAMFQKGGLCQAPLALVSSSRGEAGEATS